MRQSATHFVEKVYEDDTGWVWDMARWNPWKKLNQTYFTVLLTAFKYGNNKDKKIADMVSFLNFFLKKIGNWAKKI